MADRDIQKLLEEQRESNRISAEQLRILREQEEALKAQSKELAEQQKTAADKAKIEEEYSNQIDNALKLTKAIGKFERHHLKSQLKRSQLVSNIKLAEEEALDLRGKADKLAKSSKKIERDIAKTLYDQADSIDESVKQSKKLNREFSSFHKATKGFDRISKIVKDIPIISKAFSGFAEMSKAAGDAFVETGSRAEARIAGAQSAIKGSFQVLLTALIGGIVEGLGGINKAAVNFEKSLLLNEKRSKQLGKELASLKGGSLTFEEMTKSATNFSHALQTGAPASAETLRTFFTLTERLGLSAAAAAELYEYSVITGESFTETNANLIGQVAALNDTNKLSIKYTDILGDISNASEATLLSTQKFPGGIAKAAFEARKFGLSLGQLEKTSSSLLNFQSSIEAELEAELLTGRRLNLEKAREAALMDDQATLAAEIAKNVGTSAEFAGMNVIQQEALAKAFGMSRGELAKSLVQRETLLALEKESNIAGLARMDQQKQIQKLTEEYVKEGLTKQEARQKALNKLGKDELARQEAALTAQEQFQKAVKDIGNTLGQLASALIGLEDPLSKLAEAIQSFREGNAGVLADQIRDQKNQQDLVKKAEVVSDEKLQKAGITREEYLDMMTTANLKQGVGGRVGVMPDDMGFFTKEYWKYGFKSNEDIIEARKNLSKFENGTLNVNDFQIKTHPKDTLVMAGGTKFGEETNALLKELITAVKQGGEVYIDGRKVGETIALNYTAIG